MELFNNLYIGFSTLFHNPVSIGYCFFGVALGVIFGATPGIGASTTMAILLPFTYGMNPLLGIVMLTGVYVGVMYGGSIPSILINTPGAPTSVVTMFDGYPMARSGRAGKALGMAAYASVIGGTVCVVVFMLLAPIIARFAVVFGPAEYFALMVLGLSCVGGLTEDSPMKGLLSGFLGLFFATVGLDVVFGIQRYTFGVAHLFNGIAFVPVAMGLFGIAEIIAVVVKDVSEKVSLEKGATDLKNLLPDKQEWKDCAPHFARSSVIGFFIGLLPGAGASIATFLSYSVAKRTSKQGHLFGTGCIEGVAAAESANSASAMGSMIPTLTLGIPGSSTTAILLGALMIFGIAPGPSFFTTHVNTAWGLIASMYMANVFILLFGTLGLPFFVMILKIKAPVLNAMVVGFILIGAFAVSYSMVDVGIAVAFGVLGYAFKQFGVPAAPLVLGIVLGRLMENNLRLGLMLANGNFAAMISRPIVSVILLIAFGMVFGPSIKKSVLARRKAA